MKKTNRKRLELQREMVKALMAAIPAENLKYVQGGSPELETAFSCPDDSCPPGSWWTTCSGGGARQ